MDIVLDIKNRLSLFKNFYDSVRIVDPIKNKVVLNKADDFKCNHGKFIENDEFLIVDCYNIWKRKTTCENCISKKAFLKNDTFIKLEHNNGKIYLVIASPVEFEEKRYVVEILKDITNNGKVVDRSGDMTYLDLKMKNIGESITKDYLTGLYNKRYINQRLENEVERNVRKGISTIVIMVDIDLFKNINDTYGHVIGDKVLKDFSEILKNNIRSSTDWVGRYGGEEFLIILNNTDKSTGVKLSKKLRKLIEEKNFVYGDLKIKITASFGLYEVLKEEEISDIIKHADDKLYFAKMTGRNKISF